MNFDTKNYDTALIGCGYWGTNIARVLTKIKKNKIFYDLIYLSLQSNKNPSLDRSTYHHGHKL